MAHRGERAALGGYHENPERQSAGGQQRRRIVHRTNERHGLRHQGATVNVNVPFVTWLSTERTFQLTLQRPGLSAPSGTISTLFSFGSTCAAALTVAPEASCTRAVL